MSLLNKELILLIMQLCEEENLTRTAHMLEQETGYLFNLTYFEDLGLIGNWEEAEKYLSSFTALEDNEYSTKIYFEIRKQKFLEALDRNDRAAALDMLLKDLKVFAQSNRELYKEMTQLLTMDDFREHGSLKLHGDIASVRKQIVNELRVVIEANPVLQGRTRLPQIDRSRLRRLINQSLNWQHLQCAHPNPEPRMHTLFTDHKCPGPDDIQELMNEKNAMPSKSLPSYGNSPEPKISATTVDLGNLPDQASEDRNNCIDTSRIESIEHHDEEEESLDASENEIPAESNKLEVLDIRKIVGLSRCQFLLLTSEVKTDEIRRLVYTHAGHGILALTGDGCHLLWRWFKSQSNLTGEATTKFSPRLCQTGSGVFMKNDLPENNLNKATPSCFALSRNDSYVVSTSGRSINLYNMSTFKKMRRLMRSPPAATCVVFYHPNNNIIALGMNDSTITIYNIRSHEVVCKLEGHSKRISSLAFSTTSNVLVSSGADAKIFVWDCVTWEKKISTMLEIPINLLSETAIELSNDHQHILAVHETQLAIYDTNTLTRVKQWSIANFCSRISHATYSCDSSWVYALMKDDIVIVVCASDLIPRFEIDLRDYVPICLVGSFCPFMVASHPHKTNQFAVGLENGGILVMEPTGVRYLKNNTTVTNDGKES